MMALKQINQATMTSLELVDYVNSERKEKALAASVEFPSKGFAELRHDTFMAKVPEVLGSDAPKFSGTQTYGNNNSREIYTFPKREACLMAMSYSYELQAKVFDRMTALEQLVKPAAQIPQTFATALRLAAEQAERIEVLAIERDKAIATKAQIGSKREATSMATASAAKREVVKLKDRIGEAAHRASVLAVEGATKVKSGVYDWRVLKNYCMANELEIGKAWNPGMQKDVNTYPADAWMRCFGIDLHALFSDERDMT